jgi:phenylacetate-CoA ligase
MKSSKLLPVKNGLPDFFSTDIAEFEQALLSTPCADFLKEGEDMAFELFHKMAKRIPAYKDFLQKNNINPDNIKTVEDLEKVPTIDKKNYLRAYPLDQLSWDGKLDASIISSSSGSSGTPTFWPRSEAIETETTFIFELFLKNLFKIKKESTLFISCFAMGVYVGGSFTLNCCTRLNQKGYPITVVTPGISKKDALSVFNHLAKYYDHVILGGYPPLVKDILDELEAEGTNLTDHKISFQFAAESISEDFRQYMYNRVGVPDEEYLSRSMNLYGTADAAVAGHESKMTILLRKLFEANPGKCQEYFGTTTVPSLNVYYPFFKKFEVVNSELVFSSPNNSIPLCRYNIHDAGNILTFEDQLELLASFGYTQEQVAAEVGEEFMWKLPALYLHGKSDNTVTLYGLLIYSETIKKALTDSRLADSISGKFVMKTKLDEKNDQFLQLIIESKRDAVLSHSELLPIIEEQVIAVLQQENAEYATLYQTYRHRCIPSIDICSYEDPTYFATGIKHKWVQ